MASDSNDRLSIKTLLFTKAIPNYVIPIPTAGHKTYSCIDCGDRFLFQSSYDYHINRHAVVITYMCRHCNQVHTFNNRCKLLSHIRSHAFKTATINVSDLKVDPLPSSYFDNLANKHASTLNKAQNTDVTETQASQSNQPTKPKKPGKFSCLECKKEVAVTSILFKDRAKHFMQYTNKVHACPVCLFALPTTCGLKTHLRLHTSNPPFYCPECGISLTKKMIQYPYNHDCEGFRMMRATARYKCPVDGCYLFHPNEYRIHMKNNHIKKVYKCPVCVVACFNEATIAKHLATHQSEAKAIIFFQCEMCPGRLVLQSQINNHLRGHIMNSAFVYPCWACGQVLSEVRHLLQHYSDNHGSPTIEVPSKASNIEGTTDTTTLNAVQRDAAKSNLIYRVVKRCDKCKRSFTYKCKYEQISILPHECPFKCTAAKTSFSFQQQQPSPNCNSKEAKIKCHLCKKEIPENWDIIKAHYASDHKNLRCLDAKIVLRKINMKKYNNKKKRKERKFKRTIHNNRCFKNNRTSFTLNTNQSSSNPLACNMCAYEGQDKQRLEEHLLTHRDPNLAYQCMECGQCFIVKPSFTTHLLVVHAISNVEEYINVKKCYNADALLKSNFTNEDGEIEEPLRENQCQICREQFDDSEDLEKHFRVHGMAFLMKNSSNKSNSP